MTPYPYSERAKIEHACRVLSLPKGRWMLGGSGPLVLHGIEREKPLGDIDIFVDTAVWMRLMRWPKSGLELILPEDTPATRNDPAMLRTKLYDLTVDIGYAWRRRNVADIDLNFWMNNVEMVRGIPCAPLQFILDWKRRRGQAKDLGDVRAIETYMKGRPDEF